MTARNSSRLPGQAWGRKPREQTRGEVGISPGHLSKAQGKRAQIAAVAQGGQRNAAFCKPVAQLRHEACGVERDRRGAEQQNVDPCQHSGCRVAVPPF